MASGTERLLSHFLRRILLGLAVGVRIEQSEDFQTVLTALEFFIPAVFREIHPEWEHESLDGFYPIMARKTGSHEAEIFGLCILISDQTVTPFHLRLQLARFHDEVSWLECRLGEVGEDGMMRTRYEELNRAFNRLPPPEQAVNAINWVYKVTYGEWRPPEIPLLRPN